MSVPQRPFRGQTPGEEVQFGNVARPLDHGIDSQNLALRAVIPITFDTTSGTAFVLGPGNIDWYPMQLSFASSTAAQTVSFTHALGRVPHCYLNLLFDALQLPLLVTNVSAWDTALIQFAIASATATQQYTIALF